MSAEPIEGVSVLRKVPMLARASDELLTRLAASLEDVRVTAGDWLFRAGDPADALYVVASGRLTVRSPDGEVLREVGYGAPLGELGLLARQTRSASVEAKRDSTLWRVDAASFWELLESTPEFQHVLLASLSSMLRTSRAAEVERRQHVIAVVPSSPAARVEEHVVALVAALGAFGRVAVLRPDDAAHSSRAALAERYGPELDRAERANDWVVAAGSSSSEWREFITSQADRIVVVAAEERPPEWLSAPFGVPSDLVVAAESFDFVSWWDAVDPVSQVLAPAPTSVALAPVARRIAGRSIGLALSGGGARGLSHIGVYAELTAAGIEIDRVAGTSAGALGASMIALRYEPDELVDVARRYLVGPRSLSDYTIPLVSLIRAGRLEHMGNEIFGDTCLEELPKSLFTISSDMISGEMVVHRRGRLWTAVRASISIPGLMPPVRDGERLLVDGGLLNNLPADILAASDDGPIICVALKRRYELGQGFGVLGLRPPGLVRQIIWGTSESLPSLPETMMRTVDLAASNADPEEIPGVAAVIYPDVSKIGLLELGKIDHAIEVGRAATRAALERCPELVG